MNKLLDVIARDIDWDIKPACDNHELVLAAMRSPFVLCTIPEETHVWHAISVCTYCEEQKEEHFTTQEKITTKEEAVAAYEKWKTEEVVSNE